MVINNLESKHYASAVRVPASWKHTKEISVLLLISTLLSAFIYHILDIPTILNDAGVAAIEPSYNEKDPNIYEVSIKYRHSSISKVSISAVFDLKQFMVISYFPPLQHLGLNRTGHMSVQPGQDRTPKIAGRVLLDRTNTIK